MQLRACFLALASSTFTLGCDSAAPGSVRLSAYGESFVEEGIPAEALVDGYAISFSKFSVRIEEVTVGDEVSVGPHDLELTRATGGDGQEFDALDVGAGTYSNAGFSLSRVEVAGTATKDDQTLSFEWSFPTRVDYSNCETALVVSSEEEAAFEITVHADHLFYDSLVSEEPSLSFQPYADADADGNGWITEEELRTASVGRFDPGSDGDIDDLWTYLVRQVENLGHANGEAHCDAEVR